MAAASISGGIGALRGNNGSAFFFRLPLRAKSAMAEILVSDLCDDRARTPAAAAGGCMCSAQTEQPMSGVVADPIWVAAMRKSEIPDSL